MAVAPIDRKGIPRNAYIVKWVLGREQVCESEYVAGSAERSVQIEGDYAGASVSIDGCNDDEHFRPLCSLDGMLLSQITTCGIIGVRELSKYLRPRVTGGTASTKLTITLLYRVSR